MAFLLVLSATGSALADPTLDFVPDPQPAHPGQPYHIVCEVSWQGEPDEYAILTAEVTPIDWATADVIEAKSSVRDGRNVVSQTVSIVPVETGDYTTPEIAIGFVKPGELKPPAGDESADSGDAQEGYPKLRVEPFAVRVRRDLTAVWIAGGVCAGLIGLLMIAWLFRHGRRPASEPLPAEPVPDVARLTAELQTAKQRRVAGQYYAFYGALARAAKAARQDGAQLAERLHSRAQEVGYTGAHPTDDEMDSDLRELERLLRRYQNGG